MYIKVYVVDVEEMAKQDKLIAEVTVLEYERLLKLLNLTHKDVDGEDEIIIKLG